MKCRRAKSVPWALDVGCWMLDVPQFHPDDSVPHLSARNARAGRRAGARGDLYFAEPFSPPPGFQPSAVALSRPVQVRRRKGPSPATAADFLSRTARAAAARRCRHRAALATAAIHPPADRRAGRFLFHARRPRWRLGTNARENFSGKTFPSPAAAVHAFDSRRSGNAFARLDREKLARSGRVVVAMEMLVAGWGD